MMRLPHIIAILLVSLGFSKGCENDIERINLLTSDMEAPTISGSNVNVIYSDSGKVKVQILAATYEQYPKAERPYMEFPDGMEVFFYNDSLTMESAIRSDYAIYYMDEKLWRATGNVEVQKYSSGETLNTEELYWDEEKELIYSDVHTKVQSQEGTLYGERGFEASQDFSNWHLIGTSGTVNVPDEE
jgi:LPS export ABC transporter protein LptC